MIIIGAVVVLIVGFIAGCWVGISVSDRAMANLITRGSINLEKPERLPPELVGRPSEHETERHLLNGLALYRRFVAEAQVRPEAQLAKDFFRDVELWEMTIGGKYFPHQSVAIRHLSPGQKPN